MKRGLTLNLLKKEELEKIHLYTLEILEKNGVKFQGRALEYFRFHGFRIDGNQVYFTKSQVEDALKLCPKSFTLKGREDKYDIEIGTGGTLGVPAPVGPVNVSCLDKGVRQGTLEDISNLTKIYNSSSVINVASNTATEANDVPLDSRHLKVQFEVLKNSAKPFCTKIMSFEKTNQILDMTEIALGHELKNGIYVAIGSAPSLSPLAWENETSDCLIACAMRGQLVSVGTGLTTGITAPARVFGTLIMQNAELLAGIVLTQLVNPGNPVIYGTGGMPGNMRSAKYNCGSPSRMFIQTGTVEIGKNLYGLPTRTLTYGTEAKSLDIQCGLETYEGTLAGILSGADYMLSEIGTISGLMTTSYEKTIIDEEITSRLVHLRNGIDVSEDASSLDVIYEVGSGGEFLTSMDTMDYFSEDWYAEVTDWNNNSDEIDYEHTLKRANSEWKKRIEEAPETTISKDIEKDLLKYIESI